MKISNYSPFYQTLVGTILGGIVVFVLTTYVLATWLDNIVIKNNSKKK